MRVLMLSWEYPPRVVGGLGRHVHALAEALAAAGHAVTVVTAATDGAPADEVRGGVRVHRAAPDPPGLPFTDLLAWTAALNRGLAAAVARLAGPFDVVHAHDWLVGEAAEAVAAATGAPLVATLHATEAGRHQGWLPGPTSRAVHAAEWRLAHAARRLVVCSAHMRWEVDRLFGPPPGRVEVVGGGVDLARWSPDPARVAAARARHAGPGPLVVVSGRLVHEKGVQDALAALPRLRRRHRGLRLVVAGTGPHEPELRAQARSLRAGRAVRFAGFLAEDDLAPLVAAADAAVVPSRYEPFGLVALEAAAACTPLAVAAVGGLRELVRPGVTGAAFPPGDPTALAAAVGGLLADPPAARRMARAARTAVARERGWAAVAARTAGVYAAARRERPGPDARPAAPGPGPVPGEGNLLYGG